MWDFSPKEIDSLGKFLEMIVILQHIFLFDLKILRMNETKCVEREMLL